MEIKATLDKPYTKEQKIDFIVEQNHNLGYEIRKGDNGLEAWGLTAEEQEQAEKQAQVLELKKQLNDIDAKSTRSIRAKLAGTATDEDLQYLANLEEQAENIRQQIKELGV